MSFCGNCGARHGFVIERCDPSGATHERRARRRRGPIGRLAPDRQPLGPEPPHGARLARRAEPDVPRPFGVPPTEK
ncbi:hypothetical protein C6Q15_14115 [Burkholderia multivorans]|uniref:Uncharacterized protein n=1 Tax=Burkholderia multivorans TaxID=87883 RepID=A0A2S9MPP9_9BURK|nr:hypothetical protein C6Q07_30605 [Burkholderia multivorans]PRF60757.1 hypothetical protein C6Q15_14115 [Burkholderia multivorans]